MYGTERRVIKIVLCRAQLRTIRIAHLATHLAPASFFAGPKGSHAC